MERAARMHALNRFREHPGLTEHVGFQTRRRVSVVSHSRGGDRRAGDHTARSFRIDNLLRLGFLVGGIWIVGSVISGPIQLDAIRSSRLATSLGGLALGIVAFLGFVAAYLIGQRLPLISNSLHNVLIKADAGPAVLVLDCGPCERRRRRALFPRRPVRCLGIPHILSPAPSAFTWR